MRLNKYLASCGLASRRKVEEFVINGLITINGTICTVLATEVNDKDVVCYKGKKVVPQNDKVYIMLNKPKCYITSMKDDKDRKIVLDLLRGCKYKVFPVGRLDYNTQGLLLITNDGDWANEITHPSKHIAKTYEVRTKYQLTSKQLNQIRNGIVIDGIRTLPAKAKVVNFVDGYYINHVTIYEGRNREVRKMFEFLGLKIYELKRLKIGSLQLGDLAEGKYRYLSDYERELVFMEDM